MKSLKPYTNSIRLKENAYYLNKQGIDLVGTKRQFKNSNQIMHKIMRNDAYIFFNPSAWESEREFEKPVKITPDVYFYSGSTYKFLEIDNTQRWNINVDKMERYKRFKDSNLFQKKVKYFPTVIWVVKLESRKTKIKELAKEIDVFCEVYTHDEIKL